MVSEPVNLSKGSMSFEPVSLSERGVASVSISLSERGVSFEHFYFFFCEPVLLYEALGSSVLP